LEVLLAFLEIGQINNEPYDLNEFQKKSIELSRQQIKSGEYYTQEEANKITDEWLNK
jgi:hypothetical protein